MYFVDNIDEELTRADKDAYDMIINIKTHNTDDIEKIFNLDSGTINMDYLYSLCNAPKFNQIEKVHYSRAVMAALLFGIYCSEDEKLKRYASDRVKDVDFDLLVENVNKFQATSCYDIRELPSILGLLYSNDYTKLSMDLVDVMQEMSRLFSISMLRVRDFPSFSKLLNNLGNMYLVITALVKKWCNEIDFTGMNIRDLRNGALMLDNYVNTGYSLQMYWEQENFGIASIIHSIKEIPTLKSNYKRYKFKLPFNPRMTYPLFKTISRKYMTLIKTIWATNKKQDKVAGNAAFKDGNCKGGVFVDNESAYKKHQIYLQLSEPGKE